MRIGIKLMGALKAKSPAGGALELADGSTIRDALAALSIDESRLQVVMLNGKPQPDRTISLSSDDELTMLPLVGGG